MARLPSLIPALRASKVLPGASTMIILAQSSAGGRLAVLVDEIGYLLLTGGYFFSVSI